MKSLLLSFLFIFIDESNTDFGAGDLAISSLNTGFMTNLDSSMANHKLFTDIYNDLTNGNLPKFALKIVPFYSTPTKRRSNNFFNYVEADLYNSISILKRSDLSSESIRNYHYLWYKYLNGETKVFISCYFTEKGNCTKFNEFVLDMKADRSRDNLMAMLKNESLGIVFKGDIFGPPCRDEKLIKTFREGFNKTRS